MNATISKTRSRPWVGAIPAATAVAALLLGLALAHLAVSALKDSRGSSGQLAGAASPAVASAATMKIVPSPVIDPGAERFVGTGDGSNGAWTRP